MNENSKNLASPNTKLILIADDDEHVRGFLETFARNEGFQVVTAKDGNDAFKKVGERLPDLIITDLRMPGQGGYETIRQLQGESGRIPVIVVTASNLNQSTIEMIRQEANVVEFMMKPVQIAVLLSALHRHLKTMPPEVQRWSDEAES